MTYGEILDLMNKSIDSHKRSQKRAEKRKKPKEKEVVEEVGGLVISERKI